MSDLLDIANHFKFPSTVEKVESYGAGIINDTYVVTFSEPLKSGNSRLGKRAILQRINTEVFPEPELIMHNLEYVIDHVQHKTMQSNSELVFPPIYKTKQGIPGFQENDGSYWRAIGFIEQTVTSDILKDAAQAREAGAALGAFHHMLGDIPSEYLHDTLPGFHYTPGYLEEFDRVKAQWQAPTFTKEDSPHSTTAFEDNDSIAKSIDYCIEQIETRRELAGLLADASPPIKLRVTHGDPKLNNILFDKGSGKAISIIDLDTIKPGLIHYDLGDCIRSCCNKGGEMPAQIADAKFDLQDFESILTGYMSNAIELLDQRDFELLYDVVRLLPFELGLRFFTDYLNGNAYFKVTAPDDNLHRACVQFQLLGSIEDQEGGVRQVIERLQQG